MGFMMNGGWVMVVLLGLSVTSVAIVLQKLLLLKSTNLIDCSKSTGENKFVDSEDRNSSVPSSSNILRVPKPKTGSPKER